MDHPCAPLLRWGRHGRSSRLERPIHTRVRIVSDRLWRDTFRARYFAVGLLAVVAILAPTLGTPVRHRARPLAFGLPYNYLLHQVQRRPGRPGAAPYTDTAACLVFGLIEPASYIATLMVMLAAVALATVIFGRANAMGAIIMGTAGLTAVSLVRLPPYGAIGVLGFVIAAGLVVVTVTEVADNERRLRQRMSSVVDGLDAVVWESSPPLARFDYVSGRAESCLAIPARVSDPAFWFANVHPDDRDRVGDDRSRPSGSVATPRVRMCGPTAESSTSTAGLVHPRPQRPWCSAPRGDDRRLRPHPGPERVVQYADLVERIKIGLLILRLETRRRQLPAPGAANPSPASPPAPARAPLGKRFYRLSRPAQHRAPPPAGRRRAHRRPFDIAHFPSGRQRTRRSSTAAFPLAGTRSALVRGHTGQTLAADALRRKALHDGSPPAEPTMLAADPGLALREARTQRRRRLLTMASTSSRRSTTPSATITATSCSRAWPTASASGSPTSS